MALLKGSEMHPYFIVQNIMYRHVLCMFFFPGIAIETKWKALCLSAFYFLLYYDYENFNKSYFSMNTPTECFKEWVRFIFGNDWNVWACAMPFYKEYIYCIFRLLKYNSCGNSMRTHLNWIVHPKIFFPIIIYTHLYVVLKCVPLWEFIFIHCFVIRLLRQILCSFPFIDRILKKHNKSSPYDMWIILLMQHFHGISTNKLKYSSSVQTTHISWEKIFFA